MLLLPYTQKTFLHFQNNILLEKLISKLKNTISASLKLTALVLDKAEALRMGVSCWEALIRSKCGSA